MSDNMNVISVAPWNELSDMMRLKLIWEICVSTGVYRR